MVIAGFVLPSPGIAARPGKTADPEYSPLAAPSIPRLLIIPTIRLRAPILSIAVDAAGVLHPPGDVSEVGWWNESARPGSPDGQTLITGHTVHTGGGVMNLLGDLRAGDLVQIKTKRGIVDYATTRVFVYTRAEVAEHAQQLFGQDRAENRLVLVTCTGWTGTEYTSNIIVFAEPLGVHNSTAEEPAAGESDDTAQANDLAEAA